MSPIFKRKKKLTKKNLFCPCWSWLKHDYWNLWAQNECSAFAVSWGRISHPWAERAELLPVGQDSNPNSSPSWLGALCFGQMWSQMWSLQVAAVSTEAGTHQPCLSRVLWRLLGWAARPEPGSLCGAGGWPMPGWWSSLAQLLFGRG